MHGIITQSCLLFMFMHTLNLVNAQEPDEVRLVGGTSSCNGRLEMKHQGKWRPADEPYWNLKSSSVVCRQLDCGYAVSTDRSYHSTAVDPVWWITSSCVGTESSLKECGTTESSNSFYRLDVNCSESVRLVNGNSLCSGRVEVKSEHSWVSVCEDDFDQQDAEVVCRELGCGAPSVLQGALFGEVKAPMWTKEFQCEGNESALLDCETSSSARNTSSAYKAMELTCSAPNDSRLVGGTSHCSGRLEMKHEEEWRPVGGWSVWNLNSSAVVCKQLGCGSAVSTERMFNKATRQSTWWTNSFCLGSESSLRECGRVESDSSFFTFDLFCTGDNDVRLVGGTSHCSGRLEMKHEEEWRPVGGWSDWNLNSTAVVCKQLGCGSAVSTKRMFNKATRQSTWLTNSFCLGSESSLRECGTVESDSSMYTFDMTCTGPQSTELTEDESKVVEETTDDNQKEGGTDPMWDKSQDGKVYVPYVIADHYTTREKLIIQGALQSFSGFSCVHFVQRSNQRDYLHIQSLDGCHSYFGRRGYNQTLSLSRHGCVVHNSVQRELLRALAFDPDHRHSDGDHSDLLTVVSGQEDGVFNKINSGNQGGSHDNHPVKQYARLSVDDMEGLNRLYNCTDKH